MLQNSAKQLYKKMQKVENEIKRQCEDVGNIFWKAERRPYLERHYKIVARSIESGDILKEQYFHEGIHN